MLPSCLSSASSCPFASVFHQACHSPATLRLAPGPGATTTGRAVAVFFQNGKSYVPGVPQTFTIVITDSAARVWGFQVTAHLESNLTGGQAGDFAASTQTSGIWWIGHLATVQWRSDVANRMWHTERDHHPPRQYAMDRAQSHAHGAIVRRSRTRAPPRTAVVRRGRGRLWDVSTVNPRPNPLRFTVNYTVSLQ